MSAPDDTIAAVATAPSSSGIGVIRLSGPRSLAIAGQRFTLSASTGIHPRHLHFGRFHASSGASLDECLLVWFPAPASFTGEEVVELHCHGGAALLQAILSELFALGARQAEPGEFTKRAFLNGKLDLTQAEAVAELIAAPSKEGVLLASAKLEGALGHSINALRAKLEHLRQRICLAIDFPDEESEHFPPEEFQAQVLDLEKEISGLILAYERTRSWRDGVLVVLAGQVNAGKSSLLNALLGRPRAIVTPEPGTTRDYLEESLVLHGLPVRLMDTAGLRESADPIEQEGIRLGRKMAGTADLTLIVLDGSAAGEKLDDLIFEQVLVSELGREKCLLVWNKADLAPLGQEQLWGIPILAVSAKTGQGMEELAKAIHRKCADREHSHDELAPNLRQTRLLELALAELYALRMEIAASIPPDLCSLRLEAAMAQLEDITGLNTPEQTLNEIFASFCIGK